MFLSSNSGANKPTGIRHERFGLYGADGWQALCDQALVDATTGPWCSLVCKLRPESQTAMRQVSRLYDQETGSQPGEPARGTVFREMTGGYLGRTLAAVAPESYADHSGTGASHSLYFVRLGSLVNNREISTFTAATDTLRPRFDENHGTHAVLKIMRMPIFPSRQSLLNEEAAPWRGSPETLRRWRHILHETVQDPRGTYAITELEYPPTGGWQGFNATRTRPWEAITVNGASQSGPFATTFHAAEPGQP